MLNINTAKIPILYSICTTVTPPKTLSQSSWSCAGLLFSRWKKKEQVYICSRMVTDIKSNFLPCPPPPFWQNTIVKNHATKETCMEIIQPREDYGRKSGIKKHQRMLLDKERRTSSTNICFSSYIQWESLHPVSCSLRRCLKGFHGTLSCCLEVDLLWRRLVK